MITQIAPFYKNIGPIAPSYYQ